MPKLSIVVPTYNEAENLPALTARIHKALQGIEYEMVVVDDDSPDGTAKLAESLSSTYPISVICRKTERGLASAVVAGLRHARGDVLAVIDADLQHPPEVIIDLLQEMDRGADVVIASRYVPGGGMEGWSTIRRIISRGATLLARVALPAIGRVKDPLSGFFLVKKQAIENVQLHPIGYKILLEILARAKPAVVREIPYTFRVREHGLSKLNYREQVHFLEHIVMLASRDRETMRFVQFCLVGLSGVGVNMATFWLVTRVAGMYDLLALIVAIEASILSNFAFNETWTFRDRRTRSAREILKRGLKFNLVSTGAIIIQYSMYILLTRVAGVYDLLALLVGIVMGLAWNFGLNVSWTWKKPRAM